MIPIHSPANVVRWLASSERPDSFANKLRARRFRIFESLVERLGRPIRILDVGGTTVFWENRGWHKRSDIEILTLNLSSEPQRHSNIKPIVGDATNLTGFGDHSVDLVFSNSVIEHLFTFENQRRMASEIQRVAKAFWVQTPSFWFPMEPHFHIPGWQWLPLNTRISMIQSRRCGWRGPCPDPKEARLLVEEVRLLSGREMKVLFPAAKLIPERFCGLVKSWIAVNGFD